MAGQILGNREVAGRLWAKMKTDRVVAGQLKGRIKSRIYFLSKIWISVLWPAGLHTVGRLTAFQLAGHHTVGPLVGRPPHGRSFSWPATTRSVL
ncbi:hypothetical protein BpHYR1_034382 [Brachionus plicatilis]|uniref:Uncharacterized protein n=1 Tax=Brachionus plicatilis TaxID=10195 RepID=A0A3M7SVK8_BRAPC|nr:hypothetical protein BpHYR1_034382 [Brachionus plicatilis]